MTNFVFIFVSIGQAQIKGWGYNKDGELGIGNKNQQLNPQTITAVPDATAISGGLSHTLFLKADGTVSATGFNNWLQLGDGTREERLTPVLIKNLTNVIKVSGGWEHSVALKSDGTVWSWGSDGSGQIGNGFELNQYQSYSTPTQSSITDVVQIEAGLYHTLALKSDGTVWSWGYNKEGQLGNGTTVQSDTPVQVGTGVLEFNNIIAISAGRYSSLALKADGTVWEWGEYNVIQDNRLVIIPNPEQNTVLSEVTQIFAGDRNFVAVKIDGTVWKWNNELNGKVEYLSRPQNSYSTITTNGCKCFVAPLQINIKEVLEINGAGWAPGFFIARKRDGSVWAWGKNDYGQFGNGKIAKETVYLPEQSLVGIDIAVIGAGHYQGFAGNPSFVTPTGENVQQFGENILLKFSEVVKSGRTNYSAINPTMTNLKNTGKYTLKPNLPAYKITTTAETTGDIQVCLAVRNEYDEKRFETLKILQEVDENIVDKTSSFNYRKRELCATVTKLSSFFVAQLR